MWTYGRIASHSPDGCSVNCGLINIYPGREEECSRRDLQMIWHVSPAMWGSIVKGVAFLPSENSIDGGWTSSEFQTTMRTERTI